MGKYHVSGVLGVRVGVGDWGPGLCPAYSSVVECHSSCLPVRPRARRSCPPSSPMSTTTATMDSRSSSPKTPETSDVHHNVTIHNELPSWYRPLPIAKDASPIGVCDGDPFQKPDDERMLQLDDIIQEHAYDEYAAYHVLAFLQLISPVSLAVLHAQARKIRTPTHPQKPHSRSWSYQNHFGHHSDGPSPSLVSLYPLSRKCTPLQSCLLLLCGHANGTQLLFLAGLFIPRESRATSMSLFISYFTVLSSPCRQSCHLNAQHSRERYKVARRDAGARYCRPRTFKHLRRGTKSVRQSWLLEMAQTPTRNVYQEAYPKRGKNR